MVRVGIAGIGFMGWIHYLAYRRLTDARLSAICTRDPKKLSGDWRDIRGNFGPPGEMVDLEGVSQHANYGELLANPEIDLVDICLPPYLHADAAIAALRAGKHVFIEKPMAVTAAECDRIVQVAQEAGRLVLVGHVLPFFPEFAHARELVSEGTYGKPQGGYFKRIISDPLWLKDFYDPQRVGGPLIDLHVHDAHFIRMVFGMPTSVTSFGRMRGEVVEFCTTVFQFPDPDVVVTATSGVIGQQGRSFTHGFELYLKNATLQFEFAGFSDVTETMPLKVLGPVGQVIRPKLGDGDPIHAFEAEIQEVVNSISAGKTSPILSGELARDAVVLCHKQTESVRTGKTVKI